MLVYIHQARTEIIYWVFTLHNQNAHRLNTRHRRYILHSNEAGLLLSGCLSVCLSVHLSV